MLKHEILFYLRYAGFQLRERFSDNASALSHLLLYPFFVTILTFIWERFNSASSHYTRIEVFAYIAIAELLFMSFLRSPTLDRLGSDFSLLLARPRSWLWLSFFGQFGSTLGGRLIHFVIAGIFLAIIGFPVLELSLVLLRLLLVLPLLGVVDAVLSTVLMNLRLLWQETKYMILPISKVFLALGGVFGPLADFAEPGRSILLMLPASDLFFQPAHFAVKGSFYEISPWFWALRVSLFGLVCAALNLWLYRIARHRHLSWGG